MKVIILAAGYAVRLQPLTLNKSKSLLPIGGKLIIDRILGKLGPVKKEIDLVTIVTNHKFIDDFRCWAGSVKEHYRVSVIDDGTTSNDNRLGAIKDMALAIDREKIDDDTLVIAGDNLFEFGLDDFLAFGAAKGGVTVALRDIGSLEQAKSFGVVKVDGQYKIIKFQEKPAQPESTLISTGVYYFPKNKLSFIGEYVKMQDKLDAPGYYISWLSGRDNVYGFVFAQSWYDIGSIDSYKKADGEYTEKERSK